MTTSVPSVGIPITLARLRIVANGACFTCRGYTTHAHDPGRLRTVTTENLTVVRVDRAGALFRMNKGAVIATIRGLKEARWFWPTFEAAEAEYADCVTEALRS